MRLLYLLSVWLHLLAAAVWIGGMAFLTLVLVPIVRQPEHRAQAPLLMHRTGRRFRTVGWTCLLVLFFTGLVNLVYRGLFWAGERPLALLQGAWGHLLLLKLLLVLVIFVLSALHDFWLGPRATALGAPTPQRRLPNGGGAVLPGWGAAPCSWPWRWWR